MRAPRSPHTPIWWLATAALALALTASPDSARGAWPPIPGADLSDPANWPNDPGYDDQWNLWSFIPAENRSLVSAYELSIGSGIHADRAWQLTLGNRNVVIAVLDSGIRWQERDLVNKLYLNRGELPIPDAACGVATGLDPYDANGDGYFNVQDYTTATGSTQPEAMRICDPRVTDANANGILDPQDLIMIFSDGTDDDTNGWIDDISGWDVFHDDNDPNDDTDFGHGTGEGRDSGAETNNAIGDAGVCPECTLLMVRLGDSFVADANDFALATVFAIDSGASVIQEAVGTINGTSIMYQAIEYAWKEHVTIVASAADEDSFHANLPGSTNHTVYVHANTHNKTSRLGSDTFLAFNNCTNYGAQLLLSTPGTGCSSEATGKTSGAVGMLQSAAIDAGLAPPAGAFAPTDQFSARVLRSEEIKQLLLTSVDDIYDPADATDPEKYVTYEGWEKRFGYGRTNLRSAMDAIYAWRIPPVVDLWAPAWFHIIDPSKTPMIEVTGNIDYRSDLFDSFDYVIEWAPGIEPFPEDWTTLASGNGETVAIEGVLANWDVSQLIIDNPPMPEPDVDVNRYMVTVRARVTLHSSVPEREGTAGEIRRAFHIYQDETLVDGFPVTLDGSGEASPKITDLDGDGTMEVIMVDTAGTVHVIDGTGKPLSGWPQYLNVLEPLRESNPENHRATAGAQSGDIDPDSRGFAFQGPAVGDLDGDGPDGRSVIVASYEGEIYAFAADGTQRAGFPITLDRTKALDTSPDKTVDSGVFSSPVLADLDNDGDLEIIVAAMDAHVYVWHHDGTLAAPFPILLSDGDQIAQSVQTPSVGDIDGDGELEIVVGTNEDYDGRSRLYALDADGSLLPSWPRNLTSVSVLPLIGTGLSNSTAMADFDDDGKTDVVACGIVALPTIIRGDGTVVNTMANSPYGEASTSDDIPSFVAIANGSIGDLDNDGTLDIAWGGAGLGFAEAFAGAGVRVDFDHQLGVWNSGSGLYLPGFPQRVDDHQFFMNPAIADVDGDGRPEIINGSGGYYLRAWSADGSVPEGWPKFTGGWIMASPAVGDIDGDGKLEVAVATREGHLYVWHTEGPTDGRVDWASYHHDDHNTGNYDHPIGFGRGASTVVDDGCCSASTGRGALGSIALALLVLVTTRRRRRIFPTAR